MNDLKARPVAEWQSALGRLLMETAGPLRDVIVLPEVDSTQDAARRMRAVIGDVIVADRQTQGRGRMGRAWDDPRGEGVALTFVVARDRPERLAIAAAVAVHQAMVSVAKDPCPFRIKWPNDVLANGRKIAGILVEQVDDRALVGIGVNVEQTSFPEPLHGAATSLQMEGLRTSRFDVMAILLAEVQYQWVATDQQLIERFGFADALTGSICSFRIGQRKVRGKVLRVDPMKGLAVMTHNEGEVWLPAATTSVIVD